LLVLYIQTVGSAGQKTSTGYRKRETGNRKPDTGKAQENNPVARTTRANKKRQIGMF
jgi:hypothetical protein